MHLGHAKCTLGNFVARLALGICSALGYMVGSERIHYTLYICGRVSHDALTFWKSCWEFTSEDTSCCLGPAEFQTWIQQLKYTAKSRGWLFKLNLLFWTCWRPWFLCIIVLKFIITMIHTVTISQRLQVELTPAAFRWLWRHSSEQRRGLQYRPLTVTEW